jgi:hypothetical protein
MPRGRARRLSEAYESIVQRRPFTAAVVLWALGGVLFWLASSRIIEQLPDPLFTAALVTVFVGAPLALIIWGGLRAARDPVAWVAVPVVVMLALGLGFSGFPLSQVSVRLNFMAHKAEYDALDGDVDRFGALRGRRGQVRYVVKSQAPLVIDFPWGAAGAVWQAVTYSERTCSPTAQVRCLSPGEELAPNYYFLQAIF